MAGSEAEAAAVDEESPAKEAASNPSSSSSAGSGIGGGDSNGDVSFHSATEFPLSEREAMIRMILRPPRTEDEEEANVVLPSSEVGEQWAAYLATAVAAAAASQQQQPKAEAAAAEWMALWKCSGQSYCVVDVVRYET